MSFLFLLALSKATSALLGAMLSHASEKGGLSHSGEMGDRGCGSKGLQLKSLLWALTSIHQSLMPGWEFAHGPYGPERGDVHSPLGLGPHFSSCFGASPHTGLQQLCRCVQPARVRMQPGMAALPGHSHPFSFSLSLGVVLPQHSARCQGHPTLTAGEPGLPVLLRHLNLRCFNGFLPPPCSRCSV